MPHSVLRRYTPPTCTLEVIGSHSPLSRWMAQPVVKNLRFQLSLDDPKLPQDRWVTLRGDRAQLEALCEAVSIYVQQFLEQSHTPAQELVAVSGMGGAIAQIPDSLKPYSRFPFSQSNTLGISLKPCGLLAHELILGSLADAETGASVRLSALQLFDLANALDDYATEIVALPNLQPARPNWLRTSPAWAQIAAVCLVVVGLSTSVAKLFDASLSSNSASNSQGASSSDQRMANQVPPGATGGIPPTASNQKLPPPPPPGATVPITPGMPKIGTPSTVPAPNAKSSGATGKTASDAGIQSPKRSIAPSKDEIALNQEQPNMAPAAPAPMLKPELGNAPMARRSAASESGTASDRVDSPETRGSTSPSQNSTAFDTIPQVAEARRYIQQRWKPPQGLTQTLEYSLIINSNGSIQQIQPLGATAGDYVDRTNLPLIGEPFVSAIKNGQTAKIRAVLSPDGSVQTFLEQLY